MAKKEKPSAARISDLAAIAEEIKERHLAGSPLLTPAVAHTVLLLRIVELLEDHGR